MKKISHLMKSAILVYFFLLFQNFEAQSPEKMSYQAVVRNASNALITNQAIGVRISILKTSPAGTEIYKETFSPNPLTSSSGLLSLEIGSGTPVTGTFSSIDWASGPYFAKIEIDPAGGTNYTLISNSQLLSVPYALFAKSTSGISGTANTLSKFTSANALGNSQLTDDGTSVGVNTGTLSPNIKFQVTAGSIGNTIRGTLVGTPSTSIATAGSVYGESTTGIGVIGVSGSQNGVYGLSTGTLGGTVGVSTGTGNGIWGVATGAGVAGFFDGGATGRGIIVSNGASGIGTSTPTARLEVKQPATPVTGLDDNAAIVAYSYTAAAALKGGINGSYNTSNYGTGVHGVGYQGVNLSDANTNFSTGNQDIGVYGSANTAGIEGASINGIGVVGYNKNSSFAATTGGGNTYGVYGYANTIGGATVPATRYGVYGYATGATTNYAGYFSGNVQITGSISKGSGTFKIDHPVDPENKYLYHSFVESPDMMNIYNGNITTDDNGYATVKLPGYFDALNKDFRYQLTVIGTFASAIVSQEIKDNAFMIRTDKPSVKVSWQVTGIRKDNYANAHRVIPEVDKEPEMRGKYLHPVEMGKSPRLGIDEYTRPKDASEIKKDKDVKTNENKEKTASTQQNKEEIAGATLKNQTIEK
ncbi:MAG: hypothetical protein P0Y62_03440 [Candidatus Chryseobacterium colombiense]|nr:hypothetical protein [Chryseobacterium sp.]WEK70611.1 MAG: hypothetical protein P0Y62_03440 [Chryseobacterium sp.]